MSSRWDYVTEEKKRNYITHVPIIIFSICLKLACTTRMRTYSCNYFFHFADCSCKSCKQTRQNFICTLLWRISQRKYGVTLGSSTIQIVFGLSESIFSPCRENIVKKEVMEHCSRTHSTQTKNCLILIYPACFMQLVMYVPTLGITNGVTSLLKEQFYEPAFLRDFSYETFTLRLCKQVKVTRENVELLSEESAYRKVFNPLL